jgi:hypothetical protein
MDEEATPSRTARISKDEKKKTNRIKVGYLEFLVVQITLPKKKPLH